MSDKSDDLQARAKILLVEDNAGLRFAVRDKLERLDYQVFEAAAGEQAERCVRDVQPHLVLLDYRLPDCDGLELLVRLKAIYDQLAVVVLTAHGSPDLASRAARAGADHFLTKPVDLAALEIVIRQVVEHQRSQRSARAGKVLAERRELDPFVGESELVRQLEQRARRVADADVTLLLQGETGVGKGVLASWIHRNSPRTSEPFVDLGCAGLTPELLESELFGYQRGAFTGAARDKPGLLEIANRGTVFLDEIGDVDARVQPRLLKVIEERRFRRLGGVKDRLVDIRIVAATHQDLERLVVRGRFREDLFFRLSVFPLLVPPLRERVADIPRLAEHLLYQVAGEIGRSEELRLTLAAVQLLQAHPWPGNIRELRNLLERVVLLADGPIINARDLQAALARPGGRPAPARDRPLAEVERDHIEAVLRRAEGHVETAARRLGISRSSLYQKIRKFQLQVERPGSASR